MSIEECYQLMGGDYGQVLSRLMSPKLVSRFLAKFPEDKSYEDLESALAEGRVTDAFRAAHTLKGVCQSLGLGTLLASAQMMTDLLRGQTGEIPEQAMGCFEGVQNDYAITVDAIRSYLDSCTQDRPRA